MDILYFCAIKLEITVMDGFIYLLRDMFVWLFDNTMEPIGNKLNMVGVALLFVGLFTWLRMQAKFNKEAANNPDQLK